MDGVLCVSGSSVGELVKGKDILFSVECAALNCSRADITFSFEFPIFSAPWKGGFSFNPLIYIRLFCVKLCHNFYRFIHRCCKGNVTKSKRKQLILFKYVSYFG